jgi:hypothetical protein
VGAGASCPSPGFFTFRGEQEFNLPFRSQATEEGVYEPLRMIMNRRRFTRDSVEVLAVGYDRGILPRETRRTATGSGPTGVLWRFGSRGTS